MLWTRDPREYKQKYSEKGLFGCYYTITSSRNSLDPVGSWNSTTEKASTQVASCPITATLGDEYRTRWPLDAYTELLRGGYCRLELFPHVKT